MKLKDQLNRSIHFKSTPTRIVSLVPSQTELLCDLGLEDSLVGVTKFCVHPENIKADKAIVGGTKQVHFDKIKALNPDVILCNKEENTQDMITELETIAPVHISDINSIEDCLELIGMYGDLFNSKEKADLIIKTIQKEYQLFLEYVKKRHPFKVAYFIWKDPWMVAGNNTFINSMLTLNGFKNVYENIARYPEISLGDTDVDIELVLLSSEPYPFKEEHIKMLQPQFPNAKIHLVDGEMFSWYGSRLIKAFTYFKQLDF